MSLHCDTTADEELVHIPDEILESPRAGVKRKGGGPRLTDAQRMEILQAIETAVEAQADNKNLLKPKIPTKRLADEYGVTPAAIRKLVKQKDKFLSRFETGREDVRQSRRRGGDGAKIEFERELYRWVCGLRARNVTIVPSYIQQRALLVAKKYPNMDKFQASWGWYYRFCTRYNVTGGAISTAPASSDSHLMHLDDTSDGTLLSHMDMMYLDAAKMGDTHTLQSCLLKGTYIDSVDEAGCTALVLATQGGHFHVMKFLIEHGAKPDATDENLKTPLILAAERGDLKAIKMLLKFGANIEATDEDGLTPTELAQSLGHADLLSFDV
ncbi:hypothetical protein DYB30_008741 [Aphanomyces astaci]|uniref:HTH CENPB-type domain-containing protein n=2 Tax=Aphanomyces astaci TaxID=112090 RepID=A0A397E1P8_APHAT|nr:hypothetical protein DYB36_008637 [Aphanomyces astaci]RHY35560.1 hypothetical protein DYB38_008087 [Aphanomyces astaci]RHY71122.1 hypothetical protein DYB30_008741 [Aphanomyces astaci]RHZ10344.1 hypothetical protein DYB31_012688 [Aphanomyces astaci]